MTNGPNDDAADVAAAACRTARAEAYWTLTISFKNSANLVFYFKMAQPKIQNPVSTSTCAGGRVSAFDSFSPRVSIGRIFQKPLPTNCLKVAFNYARADVERGATERTRPPAHSLLDWRRSRIHRLKRIAKGKAGKRALEQNSKQLVLRIRQTFSWQKGGGPIGIRGGFAGEAWGR